MIAPLRSLPVFLPLLAAFAVPGTTPLSACAQVASDTSRVVIIERETRDRWIHENRHPDLVPFQQHTEVAELREASAGRLGTRGRRWTLSMGGIDAGITLDLPGDIALMHVRMPPILYSRHQDPERFRRSRILRLQGDAGVLRLPSSRVREFWVPLPDPTPEPGDRWTDTVSFQADPGEGLRERYRAVRHHHVMADTLIEGRRVLWLRTEAEVEYEQAEVDMVLNTDWWIERTLRGRTVGTMGVEIATGLRVAGADTARWEGEAVLHDPVAGPLVSGVRHEQVRTWTAYDSAGHHAAEAAARADSPPRLSGMLIFPTNELEERLRAGDSVAFDSLLTQWRAASDPEAVVDILRTLRLHAARDRWSSAHLDSLELAIALEREDTVAALEAARGGKTVSRPFTVQQAEFLLPFLEDPGRLWRLGERGRYDYDELAQMLLHSSPLLQPDSTLWRCEPQACRLVLDRLESDGDPRMHDVALVGRFARDPARWYEQLQAREEAGARTVAEAARLARGVRFEGQAPLPDATAGWDAWREWWGETPTTIPGGHLYMLQLHAHATGEDRLVELAALWPPDGDSLQAVVGEILRAAGRIPHRSPAELRDDALSGDPARINRASREAQTLLRREGAELGPEDAAGVLAPLLESIFGGGGPAWSWVEGSVADGVPRTPPSSASAQETEGIPSFLLEDHIPEPLIAELPPEVEPITEEGWKARDVREGGYLLRVQLVRRWGDFVQVTWSWTVHRNRRADESPSGYAGGRTMILVQTEEGWRAIGGTLWIT